MDGPVSGRCFRSDEALSDKAQAEGKKCKVCNVTLGQTPVFALLKDYE